ncbi:RES family NAD+ phosphorylase [Brachyspira alvinipulli]|uniref:RES family NAD+ phosphorylase n=1 Tax=Brachyspira alvinipulli TaxID=84379 RepID=UPI000484D014|nr:RES family NAD+ phosphorylase [Brachyspira alvinipulli]
MEEDNNKKDINPVWAVAIVLLYFRYKIIVDFEDFKKEIIYNNRFFPKHKIIDVVEKEALNYKFILEKDSELYRSRIFKDDVIKQELNEEKEIIGYDEKNSMAPSSEISKAGRANPEKISYLYTSADIKTSIKEVRPMIDSFVSVAEIKTLCDLTLFNILEFDIDNNENKITEFSSLNYGFSSVNYGNDIDYIPTQYIAELLKNLGFDGIRFGSSLNKGGINITLFNHKDTCKFIKSKLHYIHDIDIKYYSNIEEFVNDLKI